MNIAQGIKRFVCPNKTNVYNNTNLGLEIKDD